MDCISPTGIMSLLRIEVVVTPLGHHLDLSASYYSLRRATSNGARAAGGCCRTPAAARLCVRVVHDGRAPRVLRVGDALEGVPGDVEVGAKESRLVRYDQLKKLE
ncbi:hypothetical protein BJV78DRAFT_1362411 [Lactifluus subvellereus]|nr:hypothetical protein BJV78DRAFT_1362411 [Lactifluus subvellereus]